MLRAGARDTGKRVQAVQPKRVRKIWMPAIAGLAALLVAGTAVRAQSVEEFYRGKTINLLIGFSVGLPGMCLPM